MIRAKFIVESVTKGRNSNSVILSPVIAGSEENKSFYHYTPGGKIELHVVREETADKFKPGKEYYVDLSPAE